MLLPTASLILGFIRMTAVEANSMVPLPPALSSTCPQCYTTCDNSIQNSYPQDYWADMAGRAELLAQETSPENLVNAVANPTALNITHLCVVKLYILCAIAGRVTPIEVTAENVDKTCYNFSIPTIFLAHGWLEPALLTCGFPYTQALWYFNTGAYNVIIVDYTGCTGFWSYVAFICFGLQEVVNYVVYFITELYQRHLIDLSKIHMQGISLGCQVLAAVASAVSKTGTLIYELLGLDCAGPCFDWPELNGLVPCCGVHVVSCTDAQRVFIVATNSFPGGFGFHSYGPECMVFYINGGKVQCWGTPLMLMPGSMINHVSASPVATVLYGNETYTNRSASTMYSRSSNPCMNDTNVMVPVGNDAPFIPGYSVYMQVYLWEICPVLISDFKNCLPMVIATPSS